jgi:translocation and assembly module TamA
MKHWPALALALMVSGCAMLQPSPDAATGTAFAPPLRLTVRAPDDLQALLQRHLDLARLGELAGAERIDDNELARLVAAAPAQAQELLETEGYFDARIDLRRDGDSVVMTVQPGQRARIGRIDIEVQGDLQDQADNGDADALALLASLRRNWALPVGRGFRNLDWNDAKAELLTRLRGAGYASATWSGTAADIDTVKRSVRVFIVADSGPLFRSGGLQVEGLESHDEATVRNLAGFDAGTPLTEALLLDFQDRLRQSGLFDSVSVSFEPEIALAAATPVRVRLREAPRQVWTLGAGVSANTGPRVSVEHLHRRPFGLAAVLRNKVEWGRLRRAWDGEISTHPLERQYRWLLGGAVERLESSDDIVLAQRLRLGRAQNLPDIDRLAFVEVERSRRQNLIASATAADSDDIALSANFHGVWRRLDSAILPTDGLTLSLQGGLGTAHSVGGASGGFVRAYGRLTAYRPLGSWFGQARLELGQLFRPSGISVPDSQQFRAGGDDSVRGYAYRSLGPLVDGAVDSGDALFTASVELARPISPRLPSVWGAVFVDAGNAAPSFAALQPAYGVGVGVRWRSPVGPLRLDWAYGVEDRRGRLHFSVGIAF